VRIPLSRIDMSSNQKTVLLHRSGPKYIGGGWSPTLGPAGRSNHGSLKRME